MKRSTPLLRRTPMRRTAKPMATGKPLAAKRMRARRKRGPNAAESRYMGAVAQLGCIVCMRLDLGATLAEVHHQREGTGAGRASHYDTMPLCFHHHRGPEGIHTLGTKAWPEKYWPEAELVAAVREALAHLLPGSTQ